MFNRLPEGIAVCEKNKDIVLMNQTLHKIAELEFTKEELSRYNRQITIPGFGIEGQKKIKNAKVFIAGIGGLGSISSYYLAAAGIERAAL